MENSLHDRLEHIVLAAIRQGRWFAEEWEEVGIIPDQRLRRLLPQALQRLKDGEPLVVNDDEAIRQMGEEIRLGLNAIKEGYGDLAMRIDTSEHLIFDKDREELRALIERWKGLCNIRRNIREIQSAIKQTNLVLSKVS